MTKGRPPRTRTPQEKKTLSLKKDRRNAYGQSDKASRKAIPLRKLLESRIARHRAASDVKCLAGAEKKEADQLESTARSGRYRLGRWAKAPDVPLADWISGQRASAARRAGRKKRARLKLPPYSRPED